MSVRTVSRGTIKSGLREGFASKHRSPPRCRLGNVNVAASRGSAYWILLGMKRTQADNIDYVVGWLCGAVFLVAPLAVAVYLLRHRWRSAFQAGVICVISLPCIIGARALMIAVGVQHKRLVWIALNVLVFLVFPLLATVIASNLPWPCQSRLHPERPRTSGKTP